jgi:SAM-dependent methyltransferase
MFDAVAIAYDLLAASPERWRREGPFLEKWLGSGTRILDLACGTGVHAHALAQGGGRLITAVDLSPAMIMRASAARPHPAITWLVGDMRHPPGGPFDRVMILGNSLNLLADRQEVRDTLAAIRTALGPGGRLLVQLLNPQLPLHREPRHMVKHGTVDGTAVSIVKSLVPHDQVTLLSLAVFARNADGQHTCRGEQATLLDLEAEELEELCENAGFSQRTRYGSLEAAFFDADSSTNVVVDAAF